MPHNQKQESEKTTVTSDGGSYDSLHHDSVVDLLKKIKRVSSDLGKNEFELAKAEFKADLKSEASMASGFLVGIAALGVTVIMLLITAILALSLVVPGWAAGLIVSGFTLLVALVSLAIGRKKRMVKPLVRTREVIQADMKLAKGDLDDHKT